MATPSPSGSRRIGRNARFGMILFVIYLLLYGGFVAINAFDYKLMAKPVEIAGGLNLAVVYGFLLIVSAFVLAMVYMFLCRVAGDDEGDAQ